VRTLLITSLATIGGCHPLTNRLGGAFDAVPEDIRASLSPEAAALVDRAFADLGPSRLADVHVHHISRDVHPSWRSWSNPIRRLRTDIFLSGAGVVWRDDVEQRYIQRLERLASHFPDSASFFLYALDRTHDAGGNPQPDQTPIYVSNDSVWEAVQQSPANFVPVISIHPARTDAIEQLHHWAERGVRYVKWLPSTMKINPADPAHDAFYRAMRAHGMILLSHTGDEHAVEAVDQELGNPLRLRRALERGVTVVALHAASNGSFRDIDVPAHASDPLSGSSQVPGIDLLMRLMDEPAYGELLYAEISAITYFNHLDKPLRYLLERPDLHHRLINGSDYPIVGLNVVIQTRALQRDGFITADERRWLNEIYRKNPLLFDFVVKRTVRHPDTGERFRPDAFLLPECWPRRAVTRTKTDAGPHGEQAKGPISSCPGWQPVRAAP
jgi:mannonate dehydratase